MNYRYMRSILFFDLPVETKKNRKDYRNFVKDIKSIGFYKMQESVYIKMSIDSQSVSSTISKVKSFIPPEGNIAVLNVTEKQFSSMYILLGECNTDVLQTEDRVIEI